MINILMEAVWSIDDKVAASYLCRKKRTIERFTALKDRRRAPSLLWLMICEFYGYDQ